MILSDQTTPRAILDPDQDRAVVSKEPLLAVVAGPGSGKTSTLVARITMLLQDGVDPDRIVVITFTNSAADELRGRLGAVTLGFIGTLHAYCYEAIRRHHAIAGLGPDVVIATEDERIKIMQEVCGSLGVKYTAKLLDPLAKIGMRELLALGEYRFRLRRWGMVDFDLILSIALELFRKLTPEQTAVDHLLIDEGQDSGETDWLIYGAIRAANLFVVGDLDQSIYAFRGARPERFLDFTREAHVIVLSRCYRSSPAVCAAASRLIAHNRERIDKAVVPVVERSGSVEWLDSADDQAEATKLVGWLSRRWLNSDRRPEDWSRFAVLAPTNDTVMRTRTLLQMLAIPCQIPPLSVRTPDMTRALLMISWAIQPANDFRGALVLRSMGRQDVEKQVSMSNRNGMSLARTAGIRLPETLDQVAEYLAHGGVGQAAIEFVNQKLPEVASLSGLLLSLSTAEDKEFDSPGIRVMTFHKAKGREFDHVAVVGLEEGVLPGKKAERLEEWRRMTFVAMTRARHDLVLSSCGLRQAGWGGKVQNPPSRFIREALG